MKNDIRYFWGKDHLLIALGRRKNYRVGRLIMLEFVILSGVATSFLLQVKSPMLTCSFLSEIACAGIIYALAVNRIFSRMCFHESIRLDNHSVTLIKRSAVSTHSRAHPLMNVRGLRFESATGSPLSVVKGERITDCDSHSQMTEIQQSGRLYLETEDGNFYFGAGISPNTALEVAGMMKLYTGTTLQLGPEWSAIHQFQTSSDY